MPRAIVPERFRARAQVQQLAVTQQQAVTVAVTEVAPIAGDLTAAQALIEDQATTLATQQAALDDLNDRVGALEP